MILGITALIVPLKVQFQLLKVDTPFMVAITFLFLWCFRDRIISRGEAAVFLVLLFSYLTFSVWFAKREASRQVKKEFADEMKDLHARPQIRLGTIALLVAFGLA